MSWFVTVLVSIVSALVPVVNLEAYLVGLEAVAQPASVWSYGLAAGLGQTIGKAVWYEGIRRGTDLEWVQRKLAEPKHQAQWQRWHDRFTRNRIQSGLLLFASAFIGFPPLLIVSMLAGHLKLNRWGFYSITLLGRTLRFAAVLGGADWLVDWTGWFR